MRKTALLLMIMTAAQAFGQAPNRPLSDVLRSARAGDSKSEYIAGMMYMFGQDTKQNLPEAVHWLSLSAEAGLPQAMVSMAMLYDVGQGVPFDPARAAQYRQQAARLGEPTAIGQINDDRNMPGQADFRRASVLNDLMKPEEAIPYAKRAAAAGSINAGLLLGRAYQFSIGVPADMVEAVRWYRQAADRGLPDAERHLAYMYEFGLGVKVNRPMALKYYDLAARAGMKDARTAAANLRSPDYDRPPPSFGNSNSAGPRCSNGYDFNMATGTCDGLYPGMQGYHP